MMDKPTGQKRARQTVLLKQKMSDTLFLTFKMTTAVFVVAVINVTNVTISTITKPSMISTL